MLILHLNCHLLSSIIISYNNLFQTYNKLIKLSDTLELSLMYYEAQRRTPSDMHRISPQIYSPHLRVISEQQDNNPTPSEPTKLANRVKQLQALLHAQRLQYSRLYDNYILYVQKCQALRKENEELQKDVMKKKHLIEKEQKFFKTALQYFEEEIRFEIGEREDKIAKQARELTFLRKHIGDVGSSRNTSACSRLASMQHAGEELEQTRNIGGFLQEEELIRLDSNPVNQNIWKIDQEFCKHLGEDHRLKSLIFSFMRKILTLVPTDITDICEEFFSNLRMYEESASNSHQKMSSIVEEYMKKAKNVLLDDSVDSDMLESLS